MSTPDGIKMMRNAQSDNQRAIDLLKSLNPTRPEDIEDRNKQLTSALKLQDIITRFMGAIEP